MKRFAIGATAALVFAWAGLAHAGTEYSASLSLPDGLPDLRTGSVGLDGDRTFVGDWTTSSDPHARGFTRDRDGTGPDAPWKPWTGNLDLHRVGGPPNTMGEAIGRSPLLDNNSSAEAYVGLRSLGARGTTEVVGDSEIDAAATWSRGFSLRAFESFTFSALCAIGIVGDDSPLDSSTWFDFNPNGSFASLTMADGLNRVRTSLTASISSAFPSSWGDVFSYSIGPGGLLSMTITNNTADLLTGTLGAGAYVNVTAPPVPEPGTWAMMILGIGVVGKLARRSAKA